jgi:hypothetical protein
MAHSKEMPLHHGAYQIDVLFFLVPQLDFTHHRLSAQVLQQNSCVIVL